MNTFIEELKKQDKLITEFDESLLCATINEVVINSNKDVIFKFKDANELP